MFIKKRCIQKNTLVTLPNLEFGVYDGVAHCNIRMKASVLIYEKLNFVSVVYMLKGFKKRNLKRVNLVNQRASRKNKLRQQIFWGKKNVQKWQIKPKRKGKKWHN